MYNIYFPSKDVRRLSLNANFLGGFKVIRTGPYSRVAPGSRWLSDVFCAVDFSIRAFRKFDRTVLFNGEPSSDVNDYYI